MAIMACRMGQGRGCCWIPNWDPYKPIDVHCIYVLCKYIYIYIYMYSYIYIYIRNNIYIYIYTPNHPENRMGYTGTYKQHYILSYFQEIQNLHNGKNNVKPVDLKLPIFSKIHLQNVCAYRVCIDTVCHIHIHTYVHIIYIYIFTHIYIHIFMPIHTYVTYVHIYIYISYYTHVYQYIYIYIYT